MPAASRAFPSGAAMTSTAPSTTDTKNEYWWRTPRSRGFSGIAAIGFFGVMALREPPVVPDDGGPRPACAGGALARSAVARPDTNYPHLRGAQQGGSLEGPERSSTAAGRARGRTRA